MMTKLFPLCFVLFCLLAVRARVDDTTTTPVPQLNSVDQINRDRPANADTNNEMTQIERSDKSQSDQDQPPTPTFQPVPSPCSGVRAFTKVAYPADKSKYIRCRDEFHYDIIPCPRLGQFNDKTKTCQNANAVADICSTEKPCLNNARCSVSSDASNGFKCTCLKDWTGERCETPLNGCVNKPCGEDTECHMLKASDYKQDYVCVCDEQKTYGPNCQETVPNPCTAYSEQFYPFAFSARAYIQCNGELIYMQPCGPSLYWDQDAKICDRKRPTTSKSPIIITKLTTPTPTTLETNREPWPSETDNSARIPLVQVKNVDESAIKSPNQNELQQSSAPQRGNLDSDGRFAFIPSRLGNRQQTRPQSNIPIDQTAQNSNFNNQWQSQENPQEQQQQQQALDNQQWQTNPSSSQNQQLQGQGNQWSQSEDFNNQNGQIRQGQQLRLENRPLPPQRGQQLLASNINSQSQGIPSDFEQEIPQHKFNQPQQGLPDRKSQEQTPQIFSNQIGQKNQQWHVHQGERISQTKNVQTQTGGLPQGVAFLQDQPNGGALRQDLTIQSSKTSQPWSQSQDGQPSMENFAETTSTERMQPQIIQSNTRFGLDQDRQDLVGSAHKLRNSPTRQESTAQFGQPQQWQNQKFQSNTEQNNDYIQNQPLSSAWTFKNGAQFQGQQDGVNQNQQLQNPQLTDSNAVNIRQGVSSQLRQPQQLPGDQLTDSNALNTRQVVSSQLRQPQQLQVDQLTDLNAMNVRQGVSNQLRQPTQLQGTSSLQNQQNNGVQSNQINQPWLQSNLLETTTAESRVRLNVDQLQSRPIQKQQLGLGIQQQQNQLLQSDQLIQSTDSNTGLRQDLSTPLGQQSQLKSQPTLRPVPPPIRTQLWSQRAQQQPTPSVAQMTYNTEGQLQGVQPQEQQMNYPSQNLRDLKRQELDTQQWQSNQFGQKNQVNQGSATQFDQLPSTTGGIRQNQGQQNDGLLRQGPAAQFGWSQTNQKQPIMANAGRSIFKSVQDINDVAYPSLSPVNAPEQLPMPNQPQTTFASSESNRQSTLNQPPRTAIWQARSQQLQPGGSLGFVVNQKIDK